MSKKDFDLLALTIRYSCLWGISGHLGHTMACEVATALATTNERFDRSRFIQACTPAGMDASYINVSSDMAGRVLSNTERRKLVSA